MDHQSNSLPNGAATIADNNTNTAADNNKSDPDGEEAHHPYLSQPPPPPQPLSAVAQMAYDRYGVLDPAKLDLMVRGIFITREEAAALPSRITPDGRPEPVGLHASHHWRAPRASRLLPSRHRVVKVKEEVPVWLAGGGSKSRRSGSGGGIDVSAGPSNREKWREDEVEVLIRMKAEGVPFPGIAQRFPNKNLKAVQEKFYKAVKDPRTPHWKQLHDQLQARHDQLQAMHDHAAAAAAAAAKNNNKNGTGTGTPSDPIGINSDEGGGMGTAGQPIEVSSGSATSTAIAELEGAGQAYRGTAGFPEALKGEGEGWDAVGEGEGEDVKTPLV